MPDVLDADLHFDCPRCGQPVSERLYGPCGACRAELVALYFTDPGLTDPGLTDAGLTPAGGADGWASRGGSEPAGRFEPGMNVVPNHVATKD